LSYPPLLFFARPQTNIVGMQLDLGTNLFGGQ
jgi:hypothetical protein